MRVEQISNPLVDPTVVRAPSRAPQRVVPTVKAALVVTDALIAAISFGAAFYFREGAALFQQGNGGTLAWSPDFAPYGALMMFVILIRLLSLRYLDLYRLRGEFSFVDDGFRIFKATAIGSLLIVAAAFLYRGGFNYRAFSYAGRVPAGFSDRAGQLLYVATPNPWRPNVFPTTRHQSDSYAGRG